MSPGLRIHHAAAFFAALALAAPAQAQFRLDLNRMIDTARNIGQATTQMSEPQEIDLGKQWAAILLGAAPLMAHPELQSYVNALGRWISLHSERPDLPWQFGVLESDNVNAFATPGGYILVTKGLLARLKSEGELAGVLGHEITHVVQKHHLKAIQKGAGLQAGANILTEFAAAKGRNPAVADKLVGGIKDLMLRGLDKDDEFESDRMGVVLAARAGYDPYGLPAVLQMLNAMNPADSELALLVSTHPAPSARLDALERAMGSQLDRFPGKPGSGQFDKLVLGK
jgi:predicted Zn-dependent protease